MLPLALCGRNGRRGWRLSTGRSGAAELIRKRGYTHGLHRWVVRQQLLLQKFENKLERFITNNIFTTIKWPSLPYDAIKAGFTLEMLIVLNCPFALPYSLVSYPIVLPFSLPHFLPSYHIYFLSPWYFTLFPGILPCCFTLLVYLIPCCLTLLLNLISYHPFLFIFLLPIALSYFLLSYPTALTDLFLFYPISYPHFLPSYLIFSA